MKTVNIITARYIADGQEYGYLKGETYALKLTHDENFPITVIGLVSFTTDEDVSKRRLRYSHLNNMLFHWNDIHDTMGTMEEQDE